MPTCSLHSPHELSARSLRMQRGGTVPCSTARCTGLLLLTAAGRLLIGSRSRDVQVPRNFSTLAQTNVYGSWNVSSPATVERFSAIGYLLAKKLRSKLNVRACSSAAVWV